MSKRGSDDGRVVHTDTQGEIAIVYTQREDSGGGGGGGDMVVVVVVVVRRDRDERW